MKLPLRIYISLIAFIWFGYVAGISFLEAPLKFQAPGITLALGLGIGRIVFGTLNKVEILFAFVIGIISFLNCKEPVVKYLIYFILIILAAQTFWLLPDLDARAQTIMNGIKPPASSLHFVYIALEAIKLILLFVLGFKNLQYTTYEFKK